MTVLPRRWRLSAPLRALVRETTLAPAQFIAPIFVTAASDVPEPIPSMPGVSRLPVPAAVRAAREFAELGIGGVLLFGIPATKDAIGSGSVGADGIVQQAVRAIKDAVPRLAVLTDVCLCEYTDHGHCGIVNGSAGHHEPRLPKGIVLDAPSVARLAEIAVSHAEAGADIVAPSAMLDGMVASIRWRLDGAGFAHLPILSYSAKYASAFYGPFRDAAQGAPAFGDRATHQMDPANRREAMREHEIDVAEGADGLMVKPALAYLDVIRETRERFPALPLAAYNVSGEYAMLKAAAANRWIDERRAVLETLTAIRRAGADLTITYHAADAARWLDS